MGIQRACDDDVSNEIILDGGYTYRLVPLCFGQLQEPSPRCATVVVHSVHSVEVKVVNSSWRDIAWSTCEAARKHGSRWDDRKGATYWLHHEKGGCCLALENNSDSPM